MFAEAKSRLSSLASSLVKHQRSLSRGRDEDDDDSGTFRPRRCPWRDLLDLIFIIEYNLLQEQPALQRHSYQRAAGLLPAIPG